MDEEEIEVEVIEENYDDSFDYEDFSEDQLADKERDLLEFNPEDIDYTTANYDDIDCEIQALEILKYLKTIDRAEIEEMYYVLLMDKFGIEEADPTELKSRDEKLYIASNFKMFVRYMFLVEYGYKFKCNWHHDYICDLLQKLFLGQMKIPRIILNIPPRYSKTQLLIYFVAWSMGMSPDSEYIWIGYAKMLAEESSFKIREVIQNEKYQSLFDVKLAGSSKAKDNFMTTKKGKVYATSTGGTLTGKGAGKLRRSWGGCIIVDDGNNTLDAFSAAQRDKANSWFANTLLSRRNNMEFTPIINIQQRVHENDISGFLLPSEGNPTGGTGEDWAHINIPAILTKADLERLEVPLDSDTVLYGDEKADEYPLWHEKISLKKLREMKASLPVLTFYGQYQQQPYSSEGSILKPEWLVAMKQPKESEIDYRVFVLDTAQTVNNRSDWSVILCACVIKGGKGVYIENIHREKLEAPELTEKTLELFRIYKPRKIYIEYKSSGIGLVQYLKREKIPLPIQRIPRNASAGDGDSLVRASSVSTYIACGYVYYKENAPWITSLFHEMTVFPTGVHDDQVDTLVDLVAQEVIPNGSQLSNINTDNIPLGENTHEEAMEIEPPCETFAEYIEKLGINYRGKKAEEFQSNPDWMKSLVG